VKVQKLQRERDINLSMKTFCRLEGVRLETREHAHLEISSRKASSVSDYRKFVIERDKLRAIAIDETGMKNRRDTTTARWPINI